MQKLENELDVIEALYSAAADPDQFDELVSTWHDRLESKHSLDDFGFYPGNIKRLARHIEGVDRILEQIQDTGEDLPPLFKQWIQNTPHPTLLVDRSLLIREKSKSAKSYWGGEHIDSLAHVFRDEDGYAQIKAAVEKLFFNVAEDKITKPIIIEPEPSGCLLYTSPSPRDS